MSAINAINCLANVKNTGVVPCPLDPEFISGAIMVPKGAQFDVTTNSGNFLTTLTALFYNSSKLARYYPFYDFEKITDSSDKLTLQSMPNGAKHPVREGYNDLMFQYFDGGLSKHQAARTFNGTAWDWFFIDTNPRTGANTLYGILGSTGNMMRAFPCNPGGFFWAHPITFNTGTERTGYNLQYSFLQKYSNDLIASLALPFDMPTALPGLADAILGASATVNATPKSFNVTLLSPQGTDLGALNSVALASGSMWTASNAGTAAAIVVTSATWVPSTTAGVPGYFTLLLATTGYPTPPAPVLINLAVPATLAAAGFDYESTGALSIASV